MFFLLTLGMIPLTLSIAEPVRSKMMNEFGYVRNLCRVLRDDLVRNVKLRWVVLYAALIYAFYMSALWFYQPYMQSTGIGLVYVGLIFAAFNIAAATTSKYAYKIEDRIGRRYSSIMLVAVLGASYFLMGNIVIWFSFIFAFLQQFARGFSKVVFSEQVNRVASSRSRATILSMMSLLANLFYSVMIITAGFLADNYGIPFALNTIGILTVVLGVPAILAIRKSKII
jgi:MFS family permease